MIEKFRWFMITFWSLILVWDIARINGSAHDYSAIANILILALDVWLIMFYLIYFEGRNENA